MNELEIINNELDIINNRLLGIVERLATLNIKMRKEQSVITRELADRKARGLTGTAAIEHHNEWMRRYGLHHLVISL